MPRLAGLLGNAPARADCGLIEAQTSLVRGGAPGPGDGWGLGTYQLDRPAVVRGLDDPDGLATAAAARWSHASVSHVRRATVGAASLENCHPFAVGSWLFAQLGTLTGLDVLEPTLWADTDPRYRALRAGETDSELVFLWILSRMTAVGIDPESSSTPLEAVAELVRDSVHVLTTWSAQAGASERASLTLLITNGSVMVGAKRGEPLHFAERARATVCDLCGEAHVEGARGYAATVIASEPFSDEAWTPVLDGSVIAVDSAGRIA